jgi:DNA-directed RNA polymerase subunit RPC12/RpoP
MSKLTDKISYLQGLAEGMKLNPEKDSHRLIMGILDVLGEVGESFEALAESQGELNEYVESIDQDLADLEANLYDEEDEKYAGDAEDAGEEDKDGRDGDEEAGNDDAEPGGALLYECPHCRVTVELDPEELDLEEEHPCPNCGKELFPELPEEVDN